VGVSCTVRAGARVGGDGQGSDVSGGLPRLRLESRERNSNFARQKKARVLGYPLLGTAALDMQQNHKVRREQADRSRGAGRRYV
jgi:hypothetical protein